jgi:hypothetical protein
VDLARIAGLYPAGVICEIMNEDGTMARVPQLIEFCKEHDIKMLTVADLIRYRMQHERYVRRVAEAILPTRFGAFKMIAYSSDVDHDQHIALVRGNLEGNPPAIAENLLRYRSKPSPKKIAACSSIFITPAAASPSIPPKSLARCHRFIFISEANSIASPLASAWCSTKAE